MFVNILICVLVATASCMPYSQEEDEFLKSILKRIPVKDRKPFLIEQLFLGYAKSNQRNITISEETTLKIFEIIMKRAYKADPLKETICFPDGSCIDPDDSGIYPSN